MGLEQPTSASAGWSGLPEPLSDHILRLAFQSGGRALPQWLCMSLVCRHAHSSHLAMLRYE